MRSLGWLVDKPGQAPDSLDILRLIIPITDRIYLFQTFNLLIILFSTYYVPGPVLGSKVTMVIKTWALSLGSQD